MLNMSKGYCAPINFTRCSSLGTLPLLWAIASEVPWSCSKSYVGKLLLGAKSSHKAQVGCVFWFSTMLDAHNNRPLKFTPGLTSKPIDDANQMGVLRKCILSTQWSHDRYSTLLYAISTMNMNTQGKHIPVEKFWCFCGNQSVFTDNLHTKQFTTCN